jgi:hypothetical protein
MLKQQKFHRTRYSLIIVPGTPEKNVVTADPVLVFLLQRQLRATNRMDAFMIQGVCGT